jgi:hypothetical protein
MITTVITFLLLKNRVDTTKGLPKSRILDLKEEKKERKKNTITDKGGETKEIKRIGRSLKRA